MDTITDLFYTVLDYAREGFDQVNAVQGLIIALIASITLPDWRRLPAFSFGAAVVHIIIDVMLPVLANGSAFQLPDLLHSYFWIDFAILIVGYLIVITVLVLIRKIILRR